MAEETLLTPEKYGIRPEGVPLTTGIVDVEAPTGQHVSLKTATWRRSESPMMKDFEEMGVPRHGDGSPHQADGQVVFLSGFGTRSLDWPTAFEGLGMYWDTVVGLDHPDAPTSSITPRERPLNDEKSFYNSGSVILRAIEAKFEDGTLNKGVTAVGMSTGCPVLLEAAAQDILESERDGRRRYIKSLILTAPAGMMNRRSFAEIAAGAGSAMGLYILKDYGSDLLYRLKHPFEKNHLNARKDSISLGELKRRIKEAGQHPEWQSVLKGQKLFDVFEYFAQKLPIDTLLEYFHRVWPDQDPHFLPETPSIKRNQELIYKNVTRKACEEIKDTDITIVLFDGDRAVPPEGFLSPEDYQEIQSVTYDGTDERKLAEINERRRLAREEINKKLAEKGKKPQPVQKSYNAAWMLKNKKLEMMLERIIMRVKNLFPNNGNKTKVIITSGTHHMTPKSDIGPIAGLITA
ncbi:MAG: hypothetical protein UV73_C0015G0028 [Candidatus Gottesmanbacteria bacterium GW2011_GWA2_43_14]|uniref:Uncharacterized protein n=1 Tax=Candidatus Gottesmanbacteria bacterium GW2011_GWA2_43_14 TaxID=1618443 RepID=A0A0G1G9N4_9BACT|nr:MAG: hypothetical protein UV73_C0015G0028 [Candidatus Gottesmanbacteria bacterium GW2011_GWA2_43_14]